MTDAFICDVVANNGDDTWDVRPRIVEFDGTNHPIIKVNAVSGIYPDTGDVVMVVTARNNLDDKKVNRFYKASETNGRIVGIAKPFLVYKFKGDYQFEGDVEIDGNLEITGDLTVQGDLTVETNATVEGDLSVDGETSTGSLTINGKDWLLHTHPNNAPAPGPTGTGTQV